jgi:beta-xylosidase
MAAKVHMVHYNPVTSKVVKRVELPHLYHTERQAWNAVEFFRALGGEWADHDSIHSHPVQVNYTVEPIRLPN